MDNQIGLAAGRAPRNFGKRPSLRIVAILDRASLEPTTGVTDDDDPPDLRGQDWSRGAPDDELASNGRCPPLAHRDWEAVVDTGAKSHGEVGPIRHRLWTS